MAPPAAAIAAVGVGHPGLGAVLEVPRAVEVRAADDLHAAVADLPRDVKVKPTGLTPNSQVDPAV
jgi:hypothetical protein